MTHLCGYSDQSDENLLITWRFLHQNDIDLCSTHLTVGSRLAYNLAINGYYDHLRQFVRKLTVDEYAVLFGNEGFVKAMILLNLEDGQYENAYCLLKNGRFERTGGLVTLWYEVLYRLCQLHITKPLTSVDKFRLRKRLPPPPSICPDGYLPHPKRSQMKYEMLKMWRSYNDVYYPAIQTIRQLAKSCELSEKQVRSWFSRMRRRRLDGHMKCSGTKRRRGRPTGGKHQFEPEPKDLVNTSCTLK